MLVEGAGGGESRREMVLRSSLLGLSVSLLGPQPCLSSPTSETPGEAAESWGGAKHLFAYKIQNSL